MKLVSQLGLRLAFQLIDRKAKDAHLLGDLYITLLNQLGIEADTFANANRKMDI